jgi:hypothetical protein
MQQEREKANECLEIMNYAELVLLVESPELGCDEEELEEDDEDELLEEAAEDDSFSFVAGLVERLDFVSLRGAAAGERLRDEEGLDGDRERELGLRARGGGEGEKDCDA